MGGRAAKPLLKMKNRNNHQQKNSQSLSIEDEQEEERASFYQMHVNEDQMESLIEQLTQMEVMYKKICKFDYVCTFGHKRQIFGQGLYISEIEEIRIHKARLRQYMGRETSSYNVQLNSDSLTECDIMLLDVFHLVQSRLYSYVMLLRYEILELFIRLASNIDNTYIKLNPFYTQMPLNSNDQKRKLVKKIYDIVYKTFIRLAEQRHQNDWEDDSVTLKGSFDMANYQAKKMVKATSLLKRKLVKAMIMKRSPGLRQFYTKSLLLQLQVYRLCHSLDQRRIAVHVLDAIKKILINQEYTPSNSKGNGGRQEKTLYKAYKYKRIRRSHLDLELRLHSKKIKLKQ